MTYHRSRIAFFGLPPERAGAGGLHFGAATIRLPPTLGRVRRQGSNFQTATQARRAQAPGPPRARCGASRQSGQDPCEAKTAAERGSPASPECMGRSTNSTEPQAGRRTLLKSRALGNVSSQDNNFLSEKSNWGPPMARRHFRSARQFFLMTLEH